jgi:hypothetical protein
MCAGQLELAKLCKGTLINLFKINIYIILISSYYLVINNTPMQSIRSNPRPDTLIRNKKKKQDSLDQKQRCCQVAEGYMDVFSLGRRST